MNVGGPGEQRLGPGNILPRDHHVQLSVPGRPALVVIDVQQGFDDAIWGPRNNMDAEARMRDLLTGWRKARAPVFHIRHDSVEPGSPLMPGQAGNRIKAVVAPLEEEPVFGKSVNSAFIGTGLEDALHAAAAETVVFIGLSTNHCVSTSARMAANLGFRTYIVEDATATFDRRALDGSIRPASEVHLAALSDLAGEFATIVGAVEALRLLDD